jgi:predicted kinase
MSGLVVVTGAPGTGKTTVAAALAAGLGWPLLALDTVKETLADALGLGDEDWSNRVGDAAAAVVFRLARATPHAVVEGWWRRERRDLALAEFTGRTAVEVFCHCAPQLVESRARERLATSRHPIHRDVINPALMTGVGESSATVTPLGLSPALVRVDTGLPDATTAALVAVRAALADRGTADRDP